MATGMVAMRMRMAGRAAGSSRDQHQLAVSRYAVLAHACGMVDSRQMALCLLQAFRALRVQF